MSKVIEHKGRLISGKWISAVIMKNDGGNCWVVKVFAGSSDAPFTVRFKSESEAKYFYDECHAAMEGD